MKGAQVVLRKSWVLLGSLYLYFSLGSALLADVTKINRHCCSLSYTEVSACRRKRVENVKNKTKIKPETHSFKVPPVFLNNPLNIYSSTTTHKDIQLYNVTKEDLNSEWGKTQHYDFKINLSKKSSGIRCRDQRDINTAAVLSWLLTSWRFNGAMDSKMMRFCTILCVQNYHHNKYALSIENRQIWVYSCWVALGIWMMVMIGPFG